METKKNAQIEETGNIQFLDAKDYNLKLPVRLSKIIDKQTLKITTELKPKECKGHFHVRPYIENKAIVFSVMIDSSY